jgi:CheY-like chemotaxis protein
MNTIPHILIVEDEPDLRSVYTDALSGDGYQLDTAVDGEEAVQKILQGNWDVILLDIVMPKKNGFDVLETVRRTIVDPAQKQQIMDSIIFMTNLDNMTDLTHALSLGPKEYVVKTQVTPGQVQELVRSFLQKRVMQAVVSASGQQNQVQQPSVVPSAAVQSPSDGTSPLQVQTLSQQQPIVPNPSTESTQQSTPQPAPPSSSPVISQAEVTTNVPTQTDASIPVSTPPPMEKGQ